MQNNTQVFLVKSNLLWGSNYREVRKQALEIFAEISAKTKRKPYIRSAYFDKQKVFFDLFWDHLFQKPPRQRVKRLKYFSCCLELLTHSKLQPETKIDETRPHEILYRFFGQTKEKNQFIVQLKENTRTKKVYLISFFPWK